MKGILKWPLIVAAVVVVLRVIVERAGAPEFVSNLLSVVVLHLLIVPLYIAIRIAMNPPPRPYFTLIKLVALYVVLARAMIIPTYWLAHIYGWQERRFGGLANPDAYQSYFVIPFGTAGMWIVGSVVLGSIAGSIVIAVLSRFLRNSAAARVPSKA